MYSLVFENGKSAHKSIANNIKNVPISIFKEFGDEQKDFVPENGKSVPRS